MNVSTVDPPDVVLLVAVVTAAHDCLRRVIIDPHSRREYGRKESGRTTIDRDAIVTRYPEVRQVGEVLDRQTTHEAPVQGLSC